MIAPALDAAQTLRALAEGEELDAAAVGKFMRAALAGDIGSEQLGAFLMGVACHGLSREARSALTLSYFDANMVNSNRMEAQDAFFDKHSTGGVGDKLTFLVLPLAGAAGVPIRKLSGGSLAHCRGTIDKLSALPGFRHLDDLDTMSSEVNRFGFSIGKTSTDLCAGDNLTYAMRNLCGAVEVPDLIAASIMSKKLALSPQGLVLDVKLGRGGLFANRVDAKMTALGMIQIAEDFGLPAQAYLTEMEVPLGRAVGGCAEVREALETLAGNAADPTMVSLAFTLAAALVQMDRGICYADAIKVIEQVHQSGHAHEAFVSWLQHRGVDVATLGNRPDDAVVFRAAGSGWITDMDALEIGRFSASMARAPGMGDIEFLHQVGDQVETGTAIARISVSARDRAMAIATFGKAIAVGDAPPTTVPPIAEVLQTTSHSIEV